MRTQTFCILERKLGGLFEEVVTSELLAAGLEEKRIAIEKGEYHNNVPSITVVVDAGWSKRSHKHSYHANSGVGLIFGYATQCLLFIRVRNKYCSICSAASSKGEDIREHCCFKNWTGSSTATESDIIVEGFNLSECMHGLRYMKFIGDGDSSVHYNIITSVPYGRHVEKIECANHAVKAYHSRLANIVKDNPSFGGSGKLTKHIITKVTQAARKAITAHSCTGDVEALRSDFHNGPKHYFGDHSNCDITTCLQKNSSSFSQSHLESHPSGLFRAIQGAGDRIVTKASQLVGNHTSNLCKNFMSIRSKMDGGKFFNWVQGGSFQHRSMAAALRVQL